MLGCFKWSAIQRASCLSTNSFRRAGQLTDLPPENLVRILGKAKQSEEYRAQHWRRETAPEVSAASSKRTEVGIHIVGHCGKVSNCPPRMPQVVPDAPDRALDLIFRPQFGVGKQDWMQPVRLRQSWQDAFEFCGVTRSYGLR